MTKYVVPICICLGGLVLLAGCTGTESAPPQRQPQAVQRVEPQEPNAAVEPNQVPARVEEASVAKKETVEPNETAAAKIDQAVAAKPQKTAEPNEARSAEPNVPATHGPGIVNPLSHENLKSEITNPQSATSFIRGYAGLLRDYVQDDGYLDYASLHRRRLDVKQLVMDLGELDPNVYAAWPKGEQLALWINAYNLKMLEIISRNYPIQSSRWLRLTWPPTDIRHIAGIWTDYKLLVMDEEFTLAEVERRFFHTTFGDPRVFLALTCACRSGPPLCKKPYEGRNLDRQLDEQVKAFLSSPQGFGIDRRNMVVHLSAIFKPAWRGKEFVARYGTDKKFKDREPETRAVLNFITNYLSREDAYFLETENYAIEYMSFDWRLNDASRG